jgi:hypothetical protein
MTIMGKMDYVVKSELSPFQEKMWHALMKTKINAEITFHRPINEVKYVTIKMGETTFYAIEYDYDILDSDQRILLSYQDKNYEKQYEYFKEERHAVEMMRVLAKEKLMKRKEEIEKRLKDLTELAHQLEELGFSRAEILKAQENVETEEG